MQHLQPLVLIGCPKFFVDRLDLASLHTAPAWPPYLNFVMAWNKGVNFGFLSDLGGRWILVALAVVISLVMMAWVRNKSDWLLPIAIGCVIGGAMGNAFDRVAYGAVMDYLNVSCCGINNPYSFNVADVLIFIGAALIAIFHDANREK